MADFLPFWAVIFLIVFGAAIAAFPAYNMYDKMKIEDMGITTDAVIKKGKYDESHDRIILEYSTKAGRRVKDDIKTNEEFWSDKKTGDKVEVRYSKDDPVLYFVTGRSDHNYIMVIIGGVISLTGLVFLMAVIRVAFIRVYEWLH